MGKSSSPTPSTRNSSADEPQTRMLIVGAGPGGLCMGARMRMASREDFIVIERADDLGGTWRDNIYPGCACDVPSHLYSLSFAQKPDWSRLYPTQPELLVYINDVAQKYGLRPHIRFRTALVRAQWDEAKALWRVRRTKARSLRAILSPPSARCMCRLSPSFWGSTLSRANHSIPPNGTSASTSLARMLRSLARARARFNSCRRLLAKSAKLSVFQRTAPWILPKLDRALSLP